MDECDGRTLRPSSAIADYGRRRPKLEERLAFAAEAAASADSAEERKDTTGVSPWRLHYVPNPDEGEGKLWSYPNPDWGEF